MRFLGSPHVSRVAGGRPLLCLLAPLIAACGSPTGSSADARPAVAPADAQISLPPDALVPVICPTGSAPPGVPEMAIPAGETLDGSFVLTANDLGTLDGIRFVTGSLILVGAATGDLVVPDLEVIGGELEIRAPGFDSLGRVSLPRLESVGGRVWTNVSSPVTAVHLPVLDAVGDWFSLSAKRVDAACLRRVEGTGGVGTHNIEAGPVSFPRLETAGTVVVRGAGPSVDIDLPALTTVSFLSIFGTGAGVLSAPALATAERLHVEASTMPSMVLGPTASIDELRLLSGMFTDLEFLRGRAVTDLDLQYLPALTSLSGLPTTNLRNLFLSALPALRDVSAVAPWTTGERLQIRITEALESIELPNLTTLTTYLAIAINPSLRTLSMPSLTTVNADFYASVGNNPMLPSCQVEAIANRIRAAQPSATFVNIGNATGPCP